MVGFRSRFTERVRLEISRNCNSQTLTALKDNNKYTLKHIRGVANLLLTRVKLLLRVKAIIQAELISSCPIYIKLIWHLMGLSLEIAPHQARQKISQKYHERFIWKNSHRRAISR